MAMKQKNLPAVVEVESVHGYKGKDLNSVGFALWGKLWKPICPIPPQLACVYAAEMSDETVKIGMTINVEERIKSVSRARCQDVLRVHHTALAPRSFMYDIEKKCHANFADRRARGEFFNITFEEAVVELDIHADEIITALAEADQHYLAELDYFFNEYLPAYEKTLSSNEILPSIRKTGFYGVQKVPSEIETLEKIFGRRTTNFLTARELKEMAALTKNQVLREGLIRIAASMITDENFIICWRDDL